MGGLGGVATRRHDFLHCVPGFIHFSQAVSSPRQIVKDHRIILALASGFLQKAVRPREVATLIRKFSENAGDLWVSWRELSSFLCVIESFLLVLEWAGIELCKLGYSAGQLGIQPQRLFKSCGSLVPRALFFVSFSQTRLRDDIVRLLFRHRLELRHRQFRGGSGTTLEHCETTFALVVAWEIFGCARGFSEGYLCQICLAHHVGGHAQVKLNLRTIGEFFGALLQNREGLLIVAAFVNNPAKRVGGSSILRLKIVSLTRQIVSFIQIIQPLSVKVSEII